MSFKNSIKMFVAFGVLSSALTAWTQDGKLRVHVDPKQAYVFVDGVPYGDGTRTVKVSAGNHSISVHNYGFTPQSRDVTVEAGTVTAVEFKLDPTPGDVKGPWGRIQIESASPAAVLLNGKTPDYFVGHGDEFNHGGLFLPCCVQELVVPPGAYPVTIQYRDKVYWSGTVNVNANERVILNAANGHQRVEPWNRGSNIESLPRFKAGTASATVAVAPVSGNLSATPGQINCGDSSSLAWNTAETVDRTISSAAGTLKEASATGQQAVQPTQTTEYTLQASGPGGTITSNTTVNVNTTVQSSLQSSSPEIRYRRIGDKVIEQGSTNLTWTTSNASSVSLDPLGSVNASDSRSVSPTPKQQNEGPVSEVQQYVLTAKNICGGSDTQTVSLRIVGSVEPIPEVPLASVFFPTGLPDKRRPDGGLVESQQAALSQVAEGFKKYLEYDPDAKLNVVGNTDERDSNARNKPLSERRANRVKQYLVSLGVPDSKIDTVGQGKDYPLNAATVKTLHSENPNKPPKDLGSFQDLVWAYNRRVDLALEPKGTKSSQYYPATAPEANLLFSSGWPDGKDIVKLAAEKTPLPVDSAPDQQPK